MLSTYRKYKVNSIPTLTISQILFKRVYLGPTVEGRNSNSKGEVNNNIEREINAIVILIYIYYAYSLSWNYNVVELSITGLKKWERIYHPDAG